MVHAVSSPALLRFDHVGCSYGTAPVVEDTSFTIAAGELCAIVGPSGGGKTTVLRAALGLLTPVFGEVYRRTGLRVGYVPQRTAIAWSVPATVAEVVAMPLRSTRRRAVRDGAVADALERFGIGELARRPMTALSGGQQQRVLLARALVTEPDLVVLDEPAVNLDATARDDALGVLRGDGAAVLLTTHDLSELALAVPRLICFNRTVVADGPPEQVLHPYVLERTFGSRLRIPASASRRPSAALGRPA